MVATSDLIVKCRQAAALSGSKGRKLTVLTVIGALLASFTFGPAAIADETPEQLRKMYDDTVKELKAAQERKNQLAEENDKLKQTVADLQKQLAAVNQQANDLKQQQAEQADKTFYLRSHYAEWEAFLRQYPELMGRWKAFLEADFLTPKHGLPTTMMDGEWPPSDEG